ncbi:MAG TPA: cell division protein ZapE [Xanthomonadaceae bacterium]|nr:cell division protein ZapE [Xanthomonadaceae bacterium]
MQASPLAAYAQGVEQGRWQDDPRQREALALLDALHRELQDRPRRSVLERVWRRTRRAPCGLYLHGGVGRGKTFLMDLFEDGLGELPRLRLHFHRFMGRVHAELKRLGDIRDPLQTVADRFSQRARVLCLDECYVADIGDAMILGNLLDGLFRCGVVLVTTSNVAPSELYRDGLQRAKFLPAIDLIERHCRVHHLDGDTDYRLRALTAAPVYHHPQGAAAEQALDALFARVAPGQVVEGGAIEVNARSIPFRRRADGEIWFDFTALCGGPRAVADYIELAQSFNTVLVSGVPVFGSDDNDAARRFIHLVDELYDRNVNLVLSAAAPPEALYRGERLAAEFQRTASRLIEMQSEEYLARAHRP